MFGYFNFILRIFILFRIFEEKFLILKIFVNDWNFPLIKL
jgi:hypothetical protein